MMCQSRARTRPSRPDDSPRGSQCPRASHRNRPGPCNRFTTSWDDIASGSGWWAPSGASARRSRSGFRRWPAASRSAPALVTELPMFRGLSLAEPGDFVVGGHEIRKTTFRESAEELRNTSGVFSADWIEACGEDLDAASARVRPGTSIGGGPAVARLATWGDAEPVPRSARAGGGSRRRRDGRLRRSRFDRPHDRAQRRQHGAAVRDRRSPPALGYAQRRDGRRRIHAPAGQLDLCRRGLPERLLVRQLHAQPGRLGSRPARAGRVQRFDLCRQGRQDRRDAHEERSRAHVRPSQLADSLLGRPQHLRQPRRVDPRRPTRPTESSKVEAPRIQVIYARSSATSPPPW